MQTGKGSVGPQLLYKFVKACSTKFNGACAWCSMGAVFLLNRDVYIETTLGADGEKVKLEIRDGKLLTSDYVVHFPIKMVNAWDNVIYTCSVMLLFQNEREVDNWCKRYNVEKGDIQPLSKVWEFASKWYGNHLKSNWRKWDLNQSADIFREFDLSGKIWELPKGNDRF